MTAKRQPFALNAGAATPQAEAERDANKALAERLQAEVHGASVPCVSRTTLHASHAVRAPVTFRLASFNVIYT